MTFEEANEIFEHWRGYIEIADKVHTIFTVVPESFLPYPVETLEKALNIVAKSYFDAGDKRMANNIQETLALHVTGYYLGGSGKKTMFRKKKLTDEEALRKMKEMLDFILDNPKLLRIKLKNLKTTQKSWAKLKDSLR